MHNNATILNELYQILGKPAPWCNQIPYSLPPFYFSHSTLQLLKPINTTTQTIPANYFNALPQIVLQRIKAAALNNVNNKSIINKVPENYFDNFAKDLLQTINLQEKANELNTLAPTLLAIGNKNIYNAPIGYFSKAINVPKQKGRVLGLLNNWAKPLVAAMLIITCGGISYFVLKPKVMEAQPMVVAPIIVPTTAPIIPATIIPNITTPIVVDSAITKLATQNIDLALNAINEDELYAYVDNHATGANFAEPINNIAAVASNLSNNNSLNNLSDAEMEQYLNENIN